MTAQYIPALEGLLSAAASALTAEGRKVGRVVLVPGVQAAWDDCCDGQLYLRTIEVYPAIGQGGAPFPGIDTQQRGAAGGRCAIHAVAVHIGLGVVRCAATLDSNGNPPSAAAITADGEAMLRDMDTLLNVLVCVAQDIKGIQTLKVDRWLPVGPQGGCHGGEWGAYLAMQPCLCQETP